MAVNLGDLLKDVPKLDTGREQIKYIRLDLIDPDPNNFYKLSGIEELAANIELFGLQQPLLVRVNPNDSERYMIVSGHRRRAALKMLAADDPERWREVACIQNQPATSPTLQQLQLIFANSDTRKMTDAEISEQAAQVKSLLYKLKEEEGYEFPGRMRDHVAEIVGASKSKLARLEVIREKLAAAWQPAWKDGTLAENTAYELARMPKPIQNLLFEEKSRTNANLKYLYTDDVKKFAERTAAINCQKCKAFGGECSNYENKMRKAAVSERWGWFHCDNKCCRDCPDLLSCKRACPKLADTIKELKANKKAVAKREAELQAEKDRPVIERISAIWQRFGLAREMAFKEFDDCKKAMNVYSMPYDATKMMQLECGEAEVTAGTNVPFGYACHLQDVEKFVALADLLGCSIDYLLCRTDIREVAQEGGAVSDSGTKEPQFIPGAWYPVSVEPPVGVELILIDSGGYADTGKYKDFGEYTMDYGDPVVLWTLMPQERDVSTAPPAVTGWRGGTPEASGKYAAYVTLEGVNGPMLRELYWNGEWWAMHNERIADEVTVVCWADRPDF